MLFRSDLAAGHVHGDLVDDKITVHMPGGEIGIEIGRDFAVRMTGGVTRVGEGTLDSEMLDGAE